jgi:hypothetical protein
VVLASVAVWIPFSISAVNPSLWATGTLLPLVPAKSVTLPQPRAEDIAAPDRARENDPANVPFTGQNGPRICNCSARRFTSIARILVDEGLIGIQSGNDRETIEVRNIMKYKDEYSKNSGASRDAFQISTDRKQ